MQKFFLVILSVFFFAPADAQNVQTATNGLYHSPTSGNLARVVGLGGTLIQNTTVDLGASFTFGFKKGTANYFTVLNNGNIGIGTITPTALFHLKAGTNSLAPLKFTSGINLTTTAAGAMEFDGTNLYFTPSAERKIIAFADLSNITGLLPATLGGTGIASFATGDMLYASAANVLSKRTIGTTGQVLTVVSGVPAWATPAAGGAQTLGIVTANDNRTADALRLSGEGNIGASGGGELVLGLLSTAKTNDSRAFIGWKNSNNTITNGLAGTLLLQGRSDIADIPIDFATGMGTPQLRMRIAGNGNVGIGSIAPAEKLSILNGNLSISSDAIAFNSSMGALKIGWANTPNAYVGLAGITNSFGLDQIDLAFYTAYGTASEKMRIMSNSGYVGIGTSAPTQKLEVKDGNFSTNQNIYASSATSKVLIGNMAGLNTSNYSLAVNGIAIFTKAIVRLTSTWPDYVFEPTYKLPTLAEVEAYLAKNKHLQDVPTAAEVEKNGIDLGDNQAILLKKIEELTLYMIALNKKVEALAKENELLQKKVNSNNK